MTTKYFDNKICDFKILLSWRFPRKKQSFGRFSSLPPRPPLKIPNFIFIVVSPSLNNLLAEKSDKIATRSVTVCSVQTYFIKEPPSPFSPRTLLPIHWVLPEDYCKKDPYIGPTILTRKCFRVKSWSTHVQLLVDFVRALRKTKTPRNHQGKILYRCSRNDYRINLFWAWNLYLFLEINWNSGENLYL